MSQAAEKQYEIKAIQKYLFNVWCLNNNKVL